jgi:AmmeMemoRadiSam system protein B
MIRPPAVAGTFYPDDSDALQSMVSTMLAEATDRNQARPLTQPKAIIAPHAGYIYSGPVAASVYALLEPFRDTIKRVVLLGPAHRVAFRGIATTRADGYATPLGRIEIDKAAIESLSSQPQVMQLDEAHANEHSLEVQLPFLQTVLSTGFTLVPLVVGDATSDEVASVLNQLWGGPETLIVVSTDLSHFHNYETATIQDQATSLAIETYSPQKISGADACGCRPLNGLLTVAKQKRLNIDVVDLRNSGDTAGPRDSVVGYGAYRLTEEAA